MDKKDGGGSDSPQRTDYKKGAPGSEKPSTQNLLNMAKNGKGLNSKSLGIFGMGKK
ncbi:MAG: hypothetical protein ACR2JS_08940 [Candidatus Nanopelagicales bacterium]